MNWKRIRRARLRAWHAVRHNYLLGFTAALLVLAGAASVGAISTTGPGLDLEQRLVVVPSMLVTAPRADAPQPPRLVMTYYLVSSQALMDTFNTVKGELRHREWLEKSAFEVLLVRTPEEQQRAQAQIEEARRNCTCLEFRIEDLRGLG